MARTALIVDDSNMNREILMDMLRDDYEVLEACNGEDAIESIMQNQDSLAVVLLDIVMPKMNGIDVLTLLCARGLVDRFPILIITSEEGEEIERSCLTLGATDFVRKPFNTGLVRQRVKNAVSLYEYKNALEERVQEQIKTLRDQADELERKNRRLKKRNDEAMELLSSIVEARSMESGQHVKRVKTYTEILARQIMVSCPEYGLTEYTVKQMASASAMHDVGKISVPDALLNKPGKLSNEEFDEMKRHTLYGAKILDETQRMWDKTNYGLCRDICMYHHERWDGKGYPEGLSGESIPISAQIVAFADCYDTLTTDRVYRKAFSTDIAFQMIIHGECGQYNPKLMECFIACRESFAKTANSYK